LGLGIILEEEFKESAALAKSKKFRKLLGTVYSRSLILLLRVIVLRRKKFNQQGERVTN